MTLKKFKNIYGKTIFILGKKIKTNKIIEFDIPESKLGDYKITRDKQEIENLIREKYLEEQK